MFLLEIKSYLFILREGLCIEVDLSLPSARVIRSLEQIIEWRGKPDAIRLDNGPEYIAQSLID
jgi:putative transposase